MKTKYVLHGGSAQHRNLKNDKFFKEILKDMPDSVNILLVHFAGEPERDHQNKERDTLQFDRAKGKKKIKYEVADGKYFLDQIKKANVVYLGGGVTDKLLAKLKEYPNLKQLFKGKTIAGESAGANVLSDYCYSKFGGGIVKCLGYVPVKIIPHYTKTHKKWKRQLDTIDGNLKTLTLENYVYEVFEI